MTNVELIVNDRHLDLYDGTSIALVFQSQSFSNLSEKQSSFSRSFTVPRTDNNNDILNNVFTFNSNSKTAYNNLNSVLRVNGIEIGSGNVIVENDGVSTEEIRITFYFDASPFYQITSETSLLDCDFENFDHYLNKDNIINSQRLDNDYVYPLIDYTGDSTKYGSTNTTTDIIINTLFPSIKYSAIISSIEKLIGYKFIGNLLDSAEFKTCIIPYSKGSFKRDRAYERRYNFTTRKPTVQTITLNDFTDLYLTEPDVNGKLNTDSKSIVPFAPYYNKTLIQPPPFNAFALSVPYQTLQYLMFADKVRISVDVSANYTANAVNTVTSFLLYSTDDNDQPTVALTTHSIVATLTDANGTVYTGVTTLYPVLFASPSLNLTYTAVNFNNLPIGNYTLNFTQVVTTVPHSPFTFKVSTNNNLPLLDSTIDSLVFTSTFISDEGTIDNDLIIKNAVPDSIYFWNTTTNYYKGLSISGYDADYVFDNTNQLFYRSLTDNINIAPPTNINTWVLADDQYCVWSRTLVTAGSILPDITVGTFLKQLSQLFCCTFIVNEDNRTVELYQLKDLYNSLFNQTDWSNKVVNYGSATWNTRANNYAQQSIFKFNNEETAGDTGKLIIQVNDSTLPASKNVIDFPYAMPRAYNVYNNLQDAPFIVRIVRLDATYKTVGSDKIHICNTETYVAQSQGSLGVLRWLRKDGALLYQTLNAGGQNDLQTIAVGADNLNSVAFSKSVNNYYKFLKYLLNDYKELTCYMLLNANDVYKIDYRKPIYLKQYGSVFYLQKINDWTPDKPTKVELLKIS